MVVLLNILDCLAYHLFVLQSPLGLEILDEELKVVVQLFLYTVYGIAPLYLLKYGQSLFQVLPSFDSRFFQNEGAHQNKP